MAGVDGIAGVVFKREVAKFLRNGLTLSREPAVQIHCECLKKRREPSHALVGEIPYCGIAQFISLCVSKWRICCLVLFNSMQQGTRLTMCRLPFQDSCGADDRPQNLHAEHTRSADEYYVHSFSHELCIGDCRRTDLRVVPERERSISQD